MVFLLKIIFRLAGSNEGFSYVVDKTPFKNKFGQRSFWCRGYYVDTVGKNAKVIAEYVRNQLQEDMMYDQISIKNIMHY